MPNLGMEEIGKKHMEEKKVSRVVTSPNGDIYIYSKDYEKNLKKQEKKRAKLNKRGEKILRQMELKKRLTNNQATAYGNYSRKGVSLLRTASSILDFSNTKKKKKSKDTRPWWVK